MSYIKLGQIADINNENLVGSVYIQDHKQNLIISNTPIFPLQVTVEVISWSSLEDYQNSGNRDAFNAEIIVIPDESIPIRQYVFNQLVSKYPSLVI